jgi:hypothetical protein
MADKWPATGPTAADETNTGVATARGRSNNKKSPHQAGLNPCEDMEETG